MEVIIPSESMIVPAAPTAQPLSSSSSTATRKRLSMLKFIPATVGGDTSIESMLQVEQVEQLHEVFVAEGGSMKALSVRRFIDVLSGILVTAASAHGASSTSPTSTSTPSAGSVGHTARRSNQHSGSVSPRGASLVHTPPASSSSQPINKIRGEVKRWAVAMASTLSAMTGRSSDGDLSARGAAAETTAGGDAGGDDLMMMREKYFVKWSDLTTNLIRAEEHKDGLQDQLLDYRRLPVISRNAPSVVHTFCPSIAIASPVTGKLITAGRDGLVKMWNPYTGAFEKNLYNSGFSWITDVSFSPNENLMYVATSNSQLAVMEFPSGSIVQQYVGSPTEDVAVTSVVNRSTVHTQRFGMLPGECGPRKIHFPNILGISQEEFTERRRVAREGPTFKTVDVKPIVGFVDTTAFCNVVEQHLCVFGTHHGSIGVFDVSEDIRQSSLITGSSIKSIRQLMHTNCHSSSVSALRYMSRSKTLFSGGLDGCLYKIPLDYEVLGDRPVRHNTAEASSGEPLKPILGMDWSERQQVLASYSSDKRIKLWSPMRPEALHVFEALPHDILSIVVIKNTEQFATLTADKMLRIFDLRTFRCIQSVQQSLANEESTGALDNNYVSILKTSVDTGGAITFDSHHSQLVCALKAPIFYSTLGGTTANEAPQTPAPPAAPQPPPQAAAVDRPAAHPGVDGLEPSESFLAQTFPAATAAASLSTFVPPSRPAHGLPVQSVLYNKSTRLLFSVDTDNLLSWNAATGECLNCAEVSRQVQKMDSMLPPSTRSLKVTKASWATSDAARIATGTQSSSFVMWNATGSIALSMMSLPSPLKQADVACLAFRGSYMLATVCNRAHIVEWNIDRVLASGAYQCDKHVMIDVSGDSISAGAIIRDSTAALGTVDSKLFLANFSTMVTHEVDLGGLDDACSSIEEILFLNRNNQCSLLVFLEDGQGLLVSVLERTVLRRLRVFRPGEAKFTATALSVAEDVLVCGDSTGRVRVFRIMAGRSTITATSAAATTTTTLLEWTCKFRLVASFQASYEAVSTIRLCDDLSALVVGSEDGFVKMYLLEDLAACLAGTSAIVTVTHVGNFGETTWNLSDSTSFHKSVLPKQQHRSLHMNDMTSPLSRNITSAPAEDVASEDFLQTVLRTARRKKYSEPLATHKSESPVRQNSPLHPSSPRLPDCVVSPLHSPRAGGGGADRPSTVPTQWPQRPNTVPDSQNLCRELVLFDTTLPLSATMKSTTMTAVMMLPTRPATQSHPTRSRSHSPREHNNDSSNKAQQQLQKQLLLCKTGSTTFCGKDLSLPIPAPPSYSSPQVILERLRGPKLTVKRRAIDAPDVDLGNGKAVKSAQSQSDPTAVAVGKSKCGGGNNTDSPLSSRPIDEGRLSPTMPKLGSSMGTFITALPALDLSAIGTGQQGLRSKAPSNASLNFSGMNQTTEEEDLLWEDSVYEDVAAAPLPLDSGAERVGGDLFSALIHSNGGGGDGVTGGGFSTEEVDNARESTKKLLTQMAQRLDLVCPSGYTEKNFSKKLNKLYRSSNTSHGEKQPTSVERRRGPEGEVHDEHQEVGGGADAVPLIAGGPESQHDVEDVDDDEVAERFLASLRTPQTAKNVAEMHDLIRHYKRNREVGGGRQVANWITRVSSQLHVEKLQIAPPSAIAKTTTMNYSFPATARGLRPAPSLMHDRPPMTPRPTRL